MKKFVLTFLTILCCTALANAQEFTVDDIKYNITGTNPNTVEVIANEYSGFIEIPSTVTYENTEYKVTSIGNDAFRDCYSLAVVIITEGVTSIGERAFYSCSLTSITIPSSVTSIGNDAFYNCKFYDIRFHNKSLLDPIENNYWGATLITIEIDDEIWYTSSDGGIVTPYDESAFDSGIINIVDHKIYFSGTVTSIGNQAFYSCSNLTSITIPSSVTSIGYFAFLDCSKLSEIHFQGVTPPTIGGGAFASIASDAVFIVPSEDAIESYKTAIGSNNVITLSDYRNSLINSIKADTTGLKLTEEETSVIQSCITKINTATMIADAKDEKAKAMNIIAIAKIDKAVGDSEDETILSIAAAAKSSIRKQSNIETIKAISDLAVAKINAIAEITTDCAGIKNTIINNWIDGAINDIRHSSTKDDVDSIKGQMLDMIQLFQDGKAEGFEEGEASGFEKGKTAAFGTMGEKQNGPAVIVTDQDGKQIILYSPKKVQYIKVTNK